MKCTVKIMPREVILDTQGRVVQSYLQSQGFEVQNLRVGKVIEIEIAAVSQEEANLKIHSMMKNGLYNPLTENYEMINV
jgi:phosphoribosylformylglycinamidine synthase PurS subunit